MAILIAPSPVYLYIGRPFSSSSLINHNTMADKLYIAETPKTVSEAKGLHLITQNTPNGQATQILLEELADVYGTPWTTTLINISTNEQKKEWFLRLNPNGRIPTLVDNTQSPPFPVIETSAQLLYLQHSIDKDARFGFKDELEQSEIVQWLFFWHGGGAPYQGQVGHFTRVAPEKIPCKPRFHDDPVVLSVSSVTDRLQMPSPGSGTKRSESLACSRFVCLASSPANHENTSPGKERANTPSQTSRRGRG